MDENDYVMYARLDGTELGGAYFAMLTHILVYYQFEWGALWTPGDHQVPPPMRNVLNLFEQHIAGGDQIEIETLSMVPPGENLFSALVVRPRTSNPSDLRMMLYNYHRTRGESSKETIRLEISNLLRSRLEVTHLAIDVDHGNYSKQWLEDSAHISREAWGYPLSPYDLNPLQGIAPEGFTLWEANKDTYQALSQVGVLMDRVPMTTEPDRSLTLTIDLPSNGVAFLIFDALPPSDEEVDTWEPGPDIDGGSDPTDGGDGGTSGGCGCNSGTPPTTPIAWLLLLASSILPRSRKKRGV